MRAADTLNSSTGWGGWGGGQGNELPGTCSLFSLSESDWLCGSVNQPD